MNFFQEFRTKIKLLLVVALCAIIIAVGGILLLRVGLGPSSPTPAQQEAGQEQGGSFQVISRDDNADYGDVYFIIEEGERHLIAESSRHASPVDPDTGYQDVRRTIRYQASEIEVSPNKKWALFKATCWETVCPQVYDTETSEIHFIDPGYTNEITWLADNRLRFEGWCDYPGTICHEDVYESASADRPWEMQLVSTGAAETQGWQTYRNDEFGFEVGYPYNYFISDIEGGGVRIAHEKWEEELVHHPFVFFQVLETDKSAQVRAEEIIQQNKDGGFGIIEEGCSIHCVSNRAKRVTVGDTFSGWSYEIRGASGGTEYIILEEPLNSSALLEIGDHTAGSRGPGDSIVPQEVFDQILSTFRFMR